MNEITMTVFTPTYNRGNLLGRLYKSLRQQDDKNFIWLIVDDGSTDNTKTVIRNFVSDGILSIEYLRQENKGKYVAHNTGVKKCTTELFVCVDSDDTLLPNAISTTKSMWAKFKDDQNVCGIVSPKFINGESRLMFNPPEKSSLSGLYNSGNLCGETMLVFRTSVIKRFLFPEIEGEHFMSESVVYERIDNQYKLVVFNKYLYVGEYQDSGLTRNIARIHWQNPYTTFIMYKTTAAYQKNYIKAIKACGAYLAWKEYRQIERDYNINKRIPFLVRIGGKLLRMHYKKLFIAQSKEYWEGTNE
ncbi:MAG: GalNAc(5)-diNAcBac-PP-undecaprenol beta-1,3-glucosyltransferase [Firmicutes bacterium ADurb.Bin419]|nr:MAG: GalNAc(5)-diNAcBac-PP-undecaprenol beta-1,3-glucosyltransferase [Firmicutes bacterium ADurb.Bin419]